jgi:hypothetical protein
MALISVVLSPTSFVVVDTDELGVSDQPEPLRADVLAWLHGIASRELFFTD